MVQTKDHSKLTVQVVTRTLPGAFTGVSLLRSAHYMFQADNEITHSRMIRALYQLEPFNRLEFHRLLFDTENDAVLCQIG